jgi:hypothetical protein
MSVKEKNVISLRRAKISKNVRIFRLLAPLLVGRLEGFESGWMLSSKMGVR